MKVENIFPLTPQHHTEKLSSLHCLQMEDRAGGLSKSGVSYTERDWPASIVMLDSRKKLEKKMRFTEVLHMNRSSHNRRDSENASHAIMQKWQRINEYFIHYFFSKFPRIANSLIHISN